MRGLRRAAGMSQRELAERSGLSERTVRRLESADPGDTRIGTVKLIADALELAPQERRTLMAGAAADDPVELPAQREWPVQAGPPVDDGLSDAARRLAHIVQARWKREEGQRGVHDPFPLPVRWRPVPADLADRWDNICRLPPGEKAQPIDLTGKLPDIAQVYRAVPSGRLVVLGEAGSGKSVLAIRFVLDHLDTRSPAEPVPVIFTLGGWDPGTPLHDWLVDRLLRDDPGLLAPAPSGSTLAAALVEAGRVLPVLDGFDELPEGLRAPAMAALNQTSLPMLLTSRPEEYAAVGTVLNWSAGVRLDDLTPTDLAHYLPRASRDADSWDPLIADLPDPLAGALRTPLMVTLARAHRDSPAALADPALDTTEAVEEHLLAGFVPAVYQDDRRWPLERVQHWLGHLARVGPVEVAWWRLGETLSRATRILAVVLASSLVTALVDIAVSLPLMLAAGLGVGSALLDGLLIGPIVGLGFGLIYGLLIVLLDVRIAPSRVRLRLGRGRVRVAPTVPTRMLAGFCGGFLVGVGYGPVSLLLRGIATGFGPLDVVIRLAMVNSLMIGLAFGLAVGAVLGVVALLESPHDLTSATGPLTILAANRATAIRTVLLFAPLLSLALYVSGVLVVAVFDGVFADLVWEGIGAAVISTVGGISGAVSYALAFTAWGQWLVLTRVCLPLMGRLPWSVTTFLTDAHARGVLRQTGAVYQFRHDRLRTHLTR
ncbi:NACHT domain-containing protein [Actinokineospora diospyrosa]